MDATAPDRTVGRGIPLRSFALIAVALYLARVMPWALSEFWYDEVITVTDFAIGPGESAPWWRVLRVYPVANNHMLYSLVLWFWVRLSGYSLAEHVIRFPSLVCGALCVLLVLYGWRRWLGDRLACVAAAMVAISPVLSAFAYQARGYSFSLLLAVVFLEGTLEITAGRYRRGLAYALPAAVLLPLVMPSNILIVAAHSLFLLVRSYPAGGWRARLSHAVPVAVAGGVGAAYYLTLWEQFTAVVAQTDGWDSSLAVLGNLILAFAAHAGPVGVVFVVQAAKATRAHVRRRPVSSRVDDALRLLLSSLAVIVPATVLREQAPFPRVFLVFLPTLTYAALRSTAHLRLWQRWSALVLIGGTVVHGFAWERAATWWTRRQLAQGAHPQNLLQQYYRGEGGIRFVSLSLGGRPAARSAIVVCDAYDYATARFYFSKVGLDPRQVQGETQLPARPETVWGPGYEGRLLVLARDEREAARLFQLVGIRRAFRVVSEGTTRSLYTTVTP